MITFPRPFSTIPLRSQPFKTRKNRGPILKARLVRTSAAREH